MVSLVLLGGGLFYLLYSGIQSKTIPIPSFMEQESQVAGVPEQPMEPAAEVTPAEPAPKPIPFSVNPSTPSAKTGSGEEDLSPLENEVISMIQQNIENPGQKSPAPAPAPVSKTEGQAPTQQSDSSLVQDDLFSVPGPQDTPVAENPVVPAPTRVKRPPPKVTSKSTRTKSTVPGLTPQQSRYFIQVGAYTLKSNADRVIQKLMTGGFSPLVQTKTVRVSMHVVYIGGFADENNPKDMISELRKRGLTPELKKNSNGSYSIILGKAKSKEQAEAIKLKLTKQGIFTSLKQMRIDSRLFIIRVGVFDSNDSALENQKKIEDMGYKDTLIRKKS